MHEYSVLIHVPHAVKFLTKGKGCKSGRVINQEVLIFSQILRRDIRELVGIRRWYLQFRLNKYNFEKRWIYRSELWCGIDFLIASERSFVWGERPYLRIYGRIRRGFLHVHSLCQSSIIQRSDTQSRSRLIKETNGPKTSRHVLCVPLKKAFYFRAICALFTFYVLFSLSPNEHKMPLWALQYCAIHSFFLFMY